MALDVEVGQVAASTGGGSQTVSVGFTPKAIILWGAFNRTTNAIVREDSSGFLGFSDGSNHGASTWQEEDNIASADNRRGSTNIASIKVTNGISTTVDSEATTTFQTNQFTIVWSNAPANAYLINYIIFGGDDITGVQLISQQKPTGGAPVTQDVNTDADVQNITEGKGIVFCMSPWRNNATEIGSNLNFSFGVTTKTITEANLGMSSDDGASTSICREHHTNIKFMSKFQASGATLLAECDFTGFDATGLTLNWTTNDSTADFLHFLIIKGGQWESGIETAKITTTGTKATTTSFQPKGLITFGVRRTASTGRALQDISLNIGAGTSSTARFCAGITNDEGNTTMQIHQWASNAIIHRIVNQSGTVLSEADIDSFNTLDFTLDWSNVGPNAFKFIWIICGDSAVAAGVPYPTIINSSVMM